MGSGGRRPRANPQPPQVDAELDVLRELLTIERARLKVALRIEDERKIIFPETTVIIRDVERLLAAVTAKERGEEPPKTKGTKRADAGPGKAPKLHDEVDDLLGSEE